MKPASRLPLLFALNVASGCAASMLVLVLFQKLQLAFGATTTSIVLGLAILLGGLGFGSLWLPRFRTGLLVGGAAIGAGFGSLIAGFYTLRLYDQTTTMIAAIAIALIVVAAAWLSRRTPELDTEIKAVESDFSPSTILWTAALSGASALGAAVVWTRQLGILMSPTAYVFSIVLAVFLIGIGIGNLVGSWIARTAQPRLALGACHMLMPVAIAWTCYTLSDSLPYWPINPFLASSPWFTFQIDMARVVWTVLPPALLWGVSLSLVAAASWPRGTVYAWHMAGAIVGALGIGLFVVPSLGTQSAQRIVLLIAAMGALTALGPYAKRHNANALGAMLSGSLMLAIWLAAQVSALPAEAIAYGRQMMSMLGQSNIVQKAEGVNSSVVISTWAGNQIYLNVNGHVQATTEVYDMALQRMLGHLPGILHPNPKSVLGLGFGAGVSAGTFTRYPGIESITICEIEPEIPKAASKYFAMQNYEVAKNPKTSIVFGDPRRFIQTTARKFDIIVTDPTDVFARRNAGLFTQEYFEDVKARLNPGGYFTIYVPLYETDLRTVQSLLATFFSAFPNATVWANTREGLGYDMVVLGQAGPLKINLDEVQARLDRADYGPVRDSLLEIGFSNAASLFKKYTGRRQDLGRWFAEAETGTDRNLRLMYFAGWGMNSYIADLIYRDMLRYRQVPRDMFAGNQDAIEEILSVFSGVPLKQVP